jgi:CubicO group peptidase (beta-lactamase class C family)
MAIRKRYLILTAVLVSLGILAVVFLVFVAFVGAVLYVTNAPTLEVAKGDSESVRLEKTEAWIQGLHDSGNFNGGVLIIKNGKTILSRCWGHTDASQEKEITSKTSMRLASVSKQFTAAAILVLAEQEKIGLDDLVVDHLKGFPYDDVTIRHLLNMTSGIPDSYMDLANEHKENLGECLEVSDVVDLVATYPRARSNQVNEVHRYSNTSYVLLAAIVESASGLSFEQFMDDELFGLLAMKNTRVWNLVSKDETFPGKAKTFSGSSDLEPTFLDGVAGDGAVFCSLDDFVIWDQFWRGNDLVSPDLINQAFARPRLSDGSRPNYGFGWVIEGDGHWHNGSWLGAATYTWQDENLYVVILDNSSSLIVDSMGLEIRGAFDD